MKEVLAKIVDAGYEAYLVGGYPRDHYMGRVTNDLDITTNAKPEELNRIFPNLDMKNQKYGSVVLKFQNEIFEITTYRRDDIYEHSRSPKKITYVKTLLEDLERRDFVMNTLCMDQDGNYIDLLHARNDIDQKIIRTVGNADQKIKEDALRILRAIRFVSMFHFQLEPSLAKAIQTYQCNVKELSYFRKKEELEKIFMSDYVECGLEYLKNMEDELEIYGFSSLYVHTSLSGIWAQLEVSPNYAFSKQERKEIETIKTLLKEDLFDPLVLYRYGSYYCSLVAEIKGIHKSKVLMAYRNLPIQHRDSIAIGVKEIKTLIPKEMINEVYEDLEVRILNHELQNSKVFLRNYIVKNYHGRNE